jgi:OmcA/MtrC family decaheme c-type cytochrome
LKILLNTITKMVNQIIMINEKQSMYLAVIAIVISVIAVGITYTSESPMGPQGVPGTAGADGAVGAVGPSGSAGPAGVIPVMDAEPESCIVCHEDAGVAHQDSYDELYQDGGITVTDITYQYTGSSTHKVTFKLTKEGEPIAASEVASIGIYYAPYTGTSFESAGRQTLKGTLTYANGVSTSIITGTSDAYDGTLASADGIIAVYGRDEVVARLPNSRVYQNKYPFAGLLELGGGVDYLSASNNDGCEKCHTVPYLKHSYIYGQVDGDPATDMYTCKVCHLDNGEGGHLEWQLLVNDPVKAIEWYGTDEDTSIFTAEQLEMYEYKTSLMNDVHMSHAMEFPYPQSMSNCVTCHEDKLDMILTEDNFNGETCKSCHPVEGSEEAGTVEIALNTLLPPAIHGAMDLETADCASCHGDGSAMGDFSTIHSGYDKVIYTSAGVKYSDAIVVTVDGASKSGNMLTVEFSATGNAGSVDSADIVPEVMIGLYGYDTKDFIVNGHDRYDSSGNGVISRSDGDLPKGAYEVGTEHEYFTTVTDDAGSWSVTHDLSEWAGMLNDGTVLRMEIAVLSMVDDADGEEVAINAVSRTFDIASNDFADDFYDDIVNVEDGCNNCHEALGTTFHAPDYGGSMTVCRMCHVGLAGGYHLEVQSRSIDSYVHAIHSMQPFDIGAIDFADEVEALHYEHHIGFPYPTHAETNCESCHVEGMYEVPDQTKSLPGLLSGTEDVEGKDRAIGDIPSYVTGPASRACGGCHRAKLLNADDANGLAAFLAHSKAGGYLIEADDNLLDVIDDIMANFE